MKAKLSAIILSCALLFTSGASLSAMAKDDTVDVAQTVCMDNVGVTKCWLGTCGHSSVIYSFPLSYSKVTTTGYYYTGFFLEPGVSQTVTFSKTVSQSMNISGGIDGEVAKASVGYTNGESKTFSVSQSVKNETSSRRYVHLGVEFENRSNTVTKKERTYNPTWHITAVDKYCTYSSNSYSQSCTVATGCGLSLRTSR